MPPSWLKRRQFPDGVSSRKLSVRLGSDGARETAAAKVKRRASLSTGTSGIRHYAEVTREVERDVLSGFFSPVAKEKAPQEAWRRDLRKPVKLAPLPKPEFGDVAGLPELARADEWARVVGAIPREALMVPGAPGPDADTREKRTLFLARAKRAVIASARAAYVATATPLGSVLYGFDPDGERARLRSKKASELYVRRTAYLRRSL